MVVIIYTAAGTHPIQNYYSHGSRFPCQKVYIHGCRASIIKVLFTQQPLLIPKGSYTRLSCIKYKSAIYTAAVSHAKIFIYMTAVHPPIKALFRGQPFSMQNVYTHCCRAYSTKRIHLFTRQSFPKKPQKNTLA